MKYLIAIGQWIWTALTFGTKFLPLFISVGLYTGLTASLTGLIFGVVSTIQSLYNTFNSWGGSLSQKIGEMFSDLLDNSWFCFFSFISSLDVVLEFFTECLEKYFSLVMSSVAGLFMSVIAISLGVISIIWVRRRVKYIMSGFGSTGSSS